MHKDLRNPGRFSVFFTGVSGPKITSRQTGRDGSEGVLHSVVSLWGPAAVLETLFLGGQS